MQNQHESRAGRGQGTLRFGLPPWPPSPAGAWLGSAFFPLMALLPRWRYMTDDAKALAKRSALSAGVLLLAFLLFRTLLPWVVLGLLGWWIWKALNR